MSSKLEPGGSTAQNAPSKGLPFLDNVVWAKLLFSALARVGRDFIVLVLPPVHAPAAVDEQHGLDTYRQPIPCIGPSVSGGPTTSNYLLEAGRLIPSIPSRLAQSFISCLCPHRDLLFHERQVCNALRTPLDAMHNAFLVTRTVFFGERTYTEHIFCAWANMLQALLIYFHVLVLVFASWNIAVARSSGMSGE